MKDILKIKNLSEIIILALEDLKIVREDSKYVIDMCEWHNTSINNSKCHICLAGCMLVRHTDIKSTDDIINGSLFNLGEERHIMYAIDEFRNHSMFSVVESFGIIHPKYLKDCTNFRSIEFNFDPNFPESREEQDIWIESVTKSALQLRELE